MINLSLMVMLCNNLDNTIMDSILLWPYADIVNIFGESVLILMHIVSKCFKLRILYCTLKSGFYR